MDGRLNPKIEAYLARVLPALYPDVLDARRQRQYDPLKFIEDRIEEVKHSIRRHNDEIRWEGEELTILMRERDALAAAAGRPLDFDACHAKAVSQPPKTSSGLRLVEDRRDETKSA